LTWGFTGAPPGTRTPNPRIKSPVLRSSIRVLYQHVCASTLARYRRSAETEYRPRTADTAWYRDIRANMEQTRNPHGLDHYGEIIAITGLVVERLRGDRRTGPARAVDTVRYSAASGPQRAVVLVLTLHGPLIVLPCSLR